MRILDVDAVTPREAAALTPHLVPGETVEAAYAAASGAVLFTNKRILLVQREHLLEEKIESASWPWRSVRHFALTEGISGASRPALRIFIGDEAQPLHLRATPGTDFGALQALLARML